MDWFRIYEEARNDQKLERLSDAQHRVWFRLLCFASKGRPRGTIRTMRPLLLAIEVAKGDVELLASTVELLVDLEILQVGDDGSYSFINWAKRQYDKPSDAPEATAERKRQERAREKARDMVEDVDDVTPLSRDVTLSHDVTPEYTDTDTEELIPAPDQHVDAPTGFDQLDDLFEKFWEIYPDRKGNKRGPKDDVKMRFSKVAVKDWPQVVEAARNYASWCSEADEWAVDPVRFFWSRECPTGLWRAYREPVKVKASRNGHNPVSVATYRKETDDRRPAPGESFALNPDGTHRLQGLNPDGKYAWGGDDPLEDARLETKAEQAYNKQMRERLQGAGRGTAA